MIGAFTSLAASRAALMVEDEVQFCQGQGSENDITQVQQVNAMAYHDLR